jgi:uncharacterized tellurite resistance protein B-like protein
MSGLDKFHNIVKILTESFQVDDEAIEDLRTILAEQRGEEVTTEQAENVGRDLISMVETLANGRTITFRRDKGHE